MNPIIRTGVLAASLAGAMTGVGYASVPLYRLFCQVTGFGGTTQKAESSLAPGAVATGQTISIRFDGNHVPTLPWRFAPERTRETVAIGARDIAFYTAKNLSSQPVTGQASYNVTPASAGKYFTKIECFCFTEQRLEPGQDIRMPVTYYVDPDILKDPDAKAIQQITLSYTFHQDRTTAAK